MRLSPEHSAVIRQGAALLAGKHARVWLFGSRTDDDRRGGDVDLLLDLDEPIEEPARLAAQLSAHVSKSMHGRRVDVLIKAPNLMHLPIHAVALAEGIRL